MTWMDLLYGDTDDLEFYLQEITKQKAKENISLNL